MHVIQTAGKSQNKSAPRRQQLLLGAIANLNYQHTYNSTNLYLLKLNYLKQLSGLQLLTDDR